MHGEGGMHGGGMHRTGMHGGGMQVQKYYLAPNFVCVVSGKVKTCNFLSGLYTTSSKEEDWCKLNVT